MLTADALMQERLCYKQVGAITFASLYAPGNSSLQQVAAWEAGVQGWQC